MDVAVLYDRRLKIVEVGSPGGTTSIPRSLDAWVELASDGRLATSDSVNVSSAAFTRVPSGVRIDYVSSTLVGYDRRDPTRAALVDAVHAMTRDDMTIHIGAVGEAFDFLADGYRVTCTP